MIYKILFEAQSSIEFKKLYETHPRFSDLQKSFENLYKNNHLKYQTGKFTSLNPLILENYCNEESLPNVLKVLDEFKDLESLLTGFKKTITPVTLEKKSEVFSGKFLPAVRDTLSHQQLSDKSYNSLGYRCPEFDSIDWKNSVIILGCSSCLDMDQDFDQTTGEHLSKILDVPVINLGVAGSSISWIWLLSNILEGKLIQSPKAVICYFSEIHRITFLEDNKIINLGPWILDDEKSSNYHKSALLTYADSSNAEIYSKSFLNNIEKIWSNTNFIKVTSFETTSEILNISLLPTVDRASDGIHSGPLSSKLRASLLAKMIRDNDLNF